MSSEKIISTYNLNQESDSAKISIIVPVYNVDDYLEKCLVSMLEQTMDDIEIICINDGSTDNSLAILEKYAKKDQRVKVINKENEGVSIARNTGLEYASGNYIMFVDSDDYVELDMCEEMYALARKKNADIVVYGGEVFTETEIDDFYLNDAQKFFEQNLTTTNAYYVDDSVNALFKERGSWPLVWNKLYKKDIVIEAGCFDERFALGEDEVFVFAVFPLAKRIAYTDKKYYHYLRNRPNSATDIIVTDYEKRSWSNLAMVKIIHENWVKLGIAEKYEKQFLDRYVDLLFDSANMLSYAPDIQREYTKQVIMYFNEAFDSFPRMMVDRFYDARNEKYAIEHKDGEIGWLHGELDRKQNEIGDLINEREVLRAKLQVFESLTNTAELNSMHNTVTGAITKLTEIAEEQKRFLEENSKKKDNLPKDKPKETIGGDKLIATVAGNNEYYKKMTEIATADYNIGFAAYKTLKEQYGEDCTFFAPAAHGIGDAYLVACYIDQWLEKNNITKFKFLLCGGAEKAMVESMFPLLKGNCVKITVQQHEFLRNFDRMCGGKTDFYFFHHYDYMQAHLQLTNDIQGYRQLNMKDLYLWKMGLPIDAPYTPPSIDRKKYSETIDQIFSEHFLDKGKTVMIAPYSTCLGSLSEDFWNPIVELLIDNGYTVCCNCAANQKPLRNTVPLMLAFDVMIPFLEAAGLFIGFRSGLCDVVSSAKCKMLVLHSPDSVFWGDGNALDYVGMDNMGLNIHGNITEMVVSDTPDDCEDVCDALRQLVDLKKGE